MATSLSNPESPQEDGEQSAPPVKKRSFVLDYLELGIIPFALGGIAASVTWVLWWFTTEPCTPELAKATGCSLSSLGRYINLDLFNKMVVHGGIVGGFGGIGSYVVFTRERQAREAAEQRAARAEQRAARAEQRAEEERQRADEERRQWLEEIKQLRAQIANGNHTG